VQAAQQIVNNGKPYVVDIDLSKFFDRINHDSLGSSFGLLTWAGGSLGSL
jgi:hypothetical protein